MSIYKDFKEQISKMDFPDFVINHAGGIKGNGFFPGASGCLDNSNEITKKKIIILGQDQDNEAGFDKTIATGHEQYSSTWRNLIKLLDESEINKNECFYTNFLLGIRKGEKSNVGKSPSVKDVNFLHSCSNILLDQIEFHRPVGIVCLGLMPYKLLSLISKELLIRNIWITEFKEIDSNNLGIIKDIKFDKLKDFSTNICVIYHPSYRTINVKRRSYRNHSGNDAEISILNDLLI